MKKTLASTSTAFFVGCFLAGAVLFLNSPAMSAHDAISRAACQGCELVDEVEIGEDTYELCEVNLDVFCCDCIVAVDADLVGGKPLECEAGSCVAKSGGGCDDGSCRYRFRYRVTLKPGGCSEVHWCHQTCLSSSWDECDGDNECPEGMGLSNFWIESNGYSGGGDGWTTVSCGCIEYFALFSGSDESGCRVLHFGVGCSACSVTGGGGGN